MDITFKTKKMVENGMVLDDRGGWIPLIDKLQMERFFIEHLASGEVLRNKRWVTIDDAKTIDKSVKAQPVNNTPVSNSVKEVLPAQATDDPQIPEELLQPKAVNDIPLQQKNDEFSFNDFLNESVPVVEPEMEETNQSDITHEHCKTMVKEGEQAETAQAVVNDAPKQEAPVAIEEVPESPETAVLVEEVVQKAPSVESFFVDHTEHETVVLSTGKLADLEKVDESLIAVTMARATRKIPTVKYNENIEEILESIEEFDEWEKDARKRQALFFAIASGVAAIIGSSAIILLMLI